MTVTPLVNVGVTTTYCCGAPTVTPGAVACPGTIGGSCTFTISQRVCVAVPITFGAIADTGEASVACVAASAENICAGCTSG